MLSWNIRENRAGRTSQSLQQPLFYVLTSSFPLQSSAVVLHPGPRMVSAECPLRDAGTALSATADSRSYLQWEVGKSQYLRLHTFLNTYRHHTIKETRDILLLTNKFWEPPHKVRDRLCCSRKPLRNSIPLHHLHNMTYPSAESQFLKGEKERSSSCPQIALGKIKYFCCRNEAPEGLKVQWCLGI